MLGNFFLKGSILILMMGFSYVLTGLCLPLAKRFGILDRPTARSSHQLLMPRGGGIAVATCFLFSTFILCYLNQLPVNDALALGVGGVLVAGIGLADDFRHRSPIVRLAIHLLAAIWALSMIGCINQLVFLNKVIQLNTFGWGLSLLGLLWMINLYNFMDGIDGLAASELVFVVMAMSIVFWYSGEWHLLWLLGLLGASVMGFLLWNWPPAKIFMGDIGSGFIGYVLGVIIILSVQHQPSLLWIWFILLGVFLIDATVTLVRRVLRGEPFYKAHRSHAFQHATDKMGSHRGVTRSVIVMNCFWLLPCALLAYRFIQYAFMIQIIALVPLFILAMTLGAGVQKEYKDADP